MASMTSCFVGVSTCRADENIEEDSDSAPAIGTFNPKSEERKTRSMKTLPAFSNRPRMVVLLELPENEVCVDIVPSQARKCFSAMDIAMYKLDQQIRLN
jgi:hypothetical protein